MHNLVKCIFTTSMCILTIAALHGECQQAENDRVMQTNNEIASEAFSSQINLIENQNVGCLFDQGVCPPSERCMDDDLFGTCVAIYADNMYFNYRIPRELLKDLKLIMRGLVEQNYTWHDLFTQCCVRAALLSSSMEMPTDLTICSEFASNGIRDSGIGSYSVDGKRAAAPVFHDGDADSVGESTFDSRLDDGDDLTGDRTTPSTLADAIRAILWDSVDQQQLRESASPEDGDDGNDGNNGIDANAGNDGERPDAPLPRTQPAAGARESAMDAAAAPSRAAKPAKFPTPPSASAVAAALSKRRSNPAFVDGRYLWLQFDPPGRPSESQAAQFVAQLNKLAGKRLLEDRFSIKDSSNEVYFRLSPTAEPSDVGRILDASRVSLSDGGKFAWKVYGFGQPENRVMASELHASWSEQTRITTTLLVCAVVMAMILALFALFIVQRFRSSGHKLREMTSSSDACDSSDYRDLCRQRMTEQSSAERSEPVSAAAAQHLAAAAGKSGGGGGAPGGGGSPHSSTGSWLRDNARKFSSRGLCIGRIRPVKRCDDPITTDMDITTGHLILTYMENYLSNKEKLEQEWADLCSYEAEQSASMAGATEENAAKNRYQDLLPYDHSRVVLKREQNASGGDYINASYIYDSDPKVKAYILAQGPTEDTGGDFWQMLWESASVTVVNLTSLLSNASGGGGHELCAQYWPSEGSRLFNKFEVHLVSEHIWCEDFIVRNFYLKNLSTGEARTVTMFHFLSWDEAGLPRSAKALLEFRRKVNKSYKGRSTPLVIHCSDGCGRSGTYALLDMALTRISKGVKEIDLAASLEHLRDQRPGLVKTKDQFEFVVTAIADEVHTVLKTLPQ